MSFRLHPNQLSILEKLIDNDNDIGIDLGSAGNPGTSG